MADVERSKGLRRVGRHYALLLWKNFILAKRTPIRTILEITLPVFFGFILLGIRHVVKSENHPDPTDYPPFSFRQLPDFNSTPEIPAPFITAYAPNTTVTTAIMNKVQSIFEEYGRIMDGNSTKM